MAHSSACHHAQIADSAARRGSAARRIAPTSTPDSAIRAPTDGIVDQGGGRRALGDLSEAIGVIVRIVDGRLSGNCHTDPAVGVLVGVGHRTLRGGLRKQVVHAVIRAGDGAVEGVDTLSKPVHCIVDKDPGRSIGIRDPDAAIEPIVGCGGDLTLAVGSLGHVVHAVVLKALGAQQRILMGGDTVSDIVGVLRHAIARVSKTEQITIRVVRERRHSTQRVGGLRDPIEGIIGGPGLLA